MRIFTTVSASTNKWRSKEYLNNQVMTWNGGVGQHNDLFLLFSQKVFP